MRLVTLLLLIQLKYTIGKTIENPRSCNDSSENDPRLKRSDEIDIITKIADKTGEGPEDIASRKTLSEINIENDDNLFKSDNDDEKAHEFASNLPQKLPLVSNLTQLPANVEKENNLTNKLNTEDAPLVETVYYKAIDPKYLIISGLSLPKVNKKLTHVNNTVEPVTSIKEPENVTLDNVNTTTVMNVSNEIEANDSIGKEIAIVSRYTDVTNIRELREHLLDHLLDYFINIINEENLTKTRKNNGKDRMKVEEKLSNYYDSRHLDMIIDDADDNYDETNVDYNSNDSEEDLLDDIKEINKENVPIINPFNTLADEINKNADETLKYSEDIQELSLNVEDSLNNTNPDGGSFNITLPEHDSPEHINLLDKENQLSFTNTTEKSEDAYDNNINVSITTTEIYFPNEPFIDATAEVDMEPFNYSEEALPDKIENIYDNGALIIDTSYEQYIDSDELQVTKNVTVHEHEIYPIVKTNRNGRRKNGLEKQESIANDTLNKANAEILTTTTANFKHDKDVKIKKSAIIDKSNKNIDQDDDDKLSENKNVPLKKSKDGYKGKLTRNTNCGGLVNKKNKNYKRHNCRKSIVLNLNINLI